MITREDILNWAVSDKLPKLDTNQIVQIALLFEPREIQFNWETKRLLIKPYAIELSWE